MNLNKKKINRIKIGEIKDFTGEDLRCADLTGADLTGVDLMGADLRCADLRKSNLRETNLKRADLRGADLRGADLRCVSLIWADLRGADLRGADLRGADLKGTNLTGVKVDYMTVGYNIACPEKGEFIGYKKANGCLIELLILEDSKRSSATTAKCRCDKAKVLNIINIKTGEKINKVASEFDKDFIYTTGEIVKVNNFDENRWRECSTGIHFFMNKENAINY